MFSTERLPCVDSRGLHLFWADEGQARQLIEDRQVRLVRRGPHVRVLVALVAEPVVTVNGVPRGAEVALHGRGTGFDSTRYSHKHDTETNPVNVWELRRLSGCTRRIFRAVLESVASR